MSAASDPRGGSDRLLPDTWRRPVLGVLGGMGPAATVSFLDALVRRTPAQTDQEHIDTVVLSHATVPDRTARLLDDGRPDPTPVLLADLALLGRLGVDRVVMTCNTSHAFLPPADQLPVDLLSLVEVGAEAAVERARELAPQDPRVTVLATDGTLLSRVYQDAVEALGGVVEVPDADGQRAVMSLIYDRVKAGDRVTPADLVELVEQVAPGEGAVLLGCTELSVLYDLAEIDEQVLPARIVDAQAALVTAVVAELAPGGAPPQGD